MNKLKKITNQELLTELRARIIAGTIEIEWEVSINSLAYYEVSEKKWTRMSFSELLKK